MKCPNKEEKCEEGEVYFVRSLMEGKIFGKKYKILNYFCPLCGWIKMFKIEITKGEFKKEEEKEARIFKL